MKDIYKGGFRNGYFRGTILYLAHDRQRLAINAVLF